MTDDSIQQYFFMEPGYRICHRQGGFRVRSGTTGACVVCGLKILASLTWAHVHVEDQALVENSPDRVFRLCWTHHHGFYDQGYISTVELLDAEDVWITNKERPMPHPRDQDITNKVLSGDLKRRNRWTENRGKRLR